MNTKDAFHQTVHSYPGGVEALASRMGMSAAVLRNKANPNHNHNVPTLADAELVQQLSGDCRVLEAMAANLGRVVVVLEEGTAPSDMAILEIMTKCWGTNGDFGAAVHQALADGRIDRREVEMIRDAVKRADQAMHQLVARIEQIAE